MSSEKTLSDLNISLVCLTQIVGNNVMGATYTSLCNGKVTMPDSISSVLDS